MITIYNRADMAHVLTRDLDPRLIDLLRRRFADLVTPYGDLTDWTEFIVVEPGDTEADVERELGFSPLVNPVDGSRFGTPTFQPFWDHLALAAGYFEMAFSFGSTFAAIVLVADDRHVDSHLLRSCRMYASDKQTPRIQWPKK
jgi:hypothetical protein